RSNPPVALLLRSLRDEAERRAPSLWIVLVTCAPHPESACTVSVFAAPGPETTSSQSGSPPSLSDAAVAITASMASRSYSSPSHVRNTACSSFRVQGGGSAAAAASPCSPALRSSSCAPRRPLVCNG